MKKRIISLILVAVMAVLALAGCAYSYEKDDMSNYATFKKAEFFAALADGSIKITDADFGIDEDGRKLKVLDTIMATVAKNVGTDNKVKEGVAGKYDVLYYCYYAEDANGNIFFASKMTEASPASLQLGLSTHEGLNEKIAALFADKNVKDYIYSTITADDTSTEDVVENKTEAGDVIYVSYTKQYTETVKDKDGNVLTNEDGTPKKATKTIKVAYEKVELNGAEGSFLAHLVGKAVGTVADVSIVESTEFETEEENTAKYSSIKINWIVDNENEIGTVKHTPYADIEAETQMEKNVYDKEVDIKDVELTYHIFPVYLVGIGNELTAEMVLEHYYNSVVATEEHSDDEEVEEDEEHKHPYSFDSLENGGYKNGEKTLAELAEELVTLRSDLSTAEKDRDTAKSAYDKAKTDAEKKKAYEDAEAKVTEVQGKVDAKVTEILGCKNDKSEDVKAALVSDLTAYQYDTLEETYKNAIKKNISKEVYTLAEKYIEFKKDGDSYVLPKKAVRAAYKRIENNLKYEFYEGKFESTDSSGNNSSSESNYKHYKGDYDQFLKVHYFGSKAADYDMQDVYDKMNAEAEEAVRDIILVYTLKELYAEEKDLSVTDEQIEEFKLTYLWYFYGSIMTEDDYKTGMLLDNIMNYILEENEDAEGNKVEYVRVKYDFKADDAEDADDSKESDGE